jgi:uncharacterized protein (DUF1778 family)
MAEKAEGRPVALALRLNAEERAAVERVAGATGLSMSGFIKRCALDAAHGRTPVILVRADVVGAGYAAAAG